jgi:DNA-binding NarL/FixJ family response regulator
MQTTAAPSISAKKDATRVLIVDDHPLLRKGVSQLIDQEKDLMVVGEAEDAHKAITAIETTKPDVALIDIALNGASGIELLKDVKARFPKLKMLVLSMHDESVYAHRALRAGASGYIMKQEGTEKVLIALRKVLRGEVYLSESMGNRVLHTLVNGRSALAGPFACGRIERPRIGSVQFDRPGPRHQAHCREVAFER